MKRNPRVLVLNNYSLERVWQEVRRGDTPDHHLYGVNHLADMGHDIRIVSGSASRAIALLTRWLAATRFPVPFGALDRQWTVMRELHEADVIYAPCGDEVTSLAYLRAVGLLKTPLVSVQHHLPNKGRLAWLREPFLHWHVRGMDAMPALSSQVSADINRRCPASQPKSSAIFWGPDASFYPRSDGPGHGVLSAGRTARDFMTLGLGASRTVALTRMVCLKADLKPEFESFGKNVHIQSPEHGQVFTYPQMMQAHLDARVLAIPLFESKGSLAGLTSLVDAMALGKPVIMTRNPYIDLDIEACGIGKWVDPGDVDGWAQAIAWFERHPDESHEMGRRARALVDEQGYNSASFALRIHRLIETAGAS